MVWYPLGSGGSVRALGVWSFVLWVVACLTGIGLFFRRGRILSAAFLGTLVVGFFGGFAGVLEPTRMPMGVATLATAGMFVGLAVGLAVPWIRRARSGPRRFFTLMTGVFLGAWVAGLLSIRTAMDAPWNCANTCQLSSVATLFSIDALALVLTAGILAIAAGPAHVEPALSPSEAAVAG